MPLQPFESATCHLCAVCVPSLDLLNVGGWWSLTVHEPPVEQRVVDEGLQHGHDAVPVLPQHLHHRVAGDPVVPVQTGHLSPNQTQLLLLETNLPQHQRIQRLYITERSKVQSGVLMRILRSLNLPIKVFITLKTFYNYKEFSVFMLSYLIPFLFGSLKTTHSESAFLMKRCTLVKDYRNYWFDWNTRYKRRSWVKVVGKVFVVEMLRTSTLQQLLTFLSSFLYKYFQAEINLSGTFKPVHTHFPGVYHSIRRHRVAYLHGVGQHPRQSEWDLFRELLSGHGDLLKVVRQSVLEKFKNESVDNRLRESVLTSKQSPKSIWRILPLNRSNMRLDGCLENRNTVPLLMITVTLMILTICTK